MAAAVEDRWGYVSPGVSPGQGGPFPKVELGRLKHDPALVQSAELWPSLPLRAVMQFLDAPLARYDFESGQIHLCGEPDETPRLPSRACGQDRKVLRAVPVEMHQVSLKKLGEEQTLAGSAHVLLVPVQLMAERRYLERAEATDTTEELQRARKPLVILGSTRDPRKEIFGDLMGYQIHAQVASDILLKRYIRPAHAGTVAAGIAAAALVGAAWRRRRRRPLGISDPSSVTKHWALSGIDMVIAGFAVAAVSYLAALIAFRSGLVILPMLYFLLATSAAYLLLAVIERRRAA